MKKLICIDNVKIKLNENRKDERHYYGFCVDYIEAVKGVFIKPKDDDDSVNEHFVKIYLEKSSPIIGECATEADAKRLRQDLIEYWVSDKTFLHIDLKDYNQI